MASLHRCPRCGAWPWLRCTFLFRGVRRVRLSYLHEEREDGHG